MEHPFALFTPISSQQTEAVTGAFSDGSGLTQFSPANPLGQTSHSRSMIKPPMGTTQALGEEGGSFPPESDF